MALLETAVTRVTRVTQEMMETPAAIHVGPQRVLRVEDMDKGGSGTPPAVWVVAAAAVLEPVMMAQVFSVTGIGWVRLVVIPAVGLVAMGAGMHPPMHTMLMPVLPPTLLELAAAVAGGVLQVQVHTVVGEEVAGTPEQRGARVILEVPQALQHIVAKQLFLDALIPLRLALVGQLPFHGVLNEEERRITGRN